MPFADEPTHYAGRSFQCGWSERRQTACDIADAVRRFALGLREIDPAYGRLRPDPGMRKVRAGDPGPIVDMAAAELADMIDRRGRFDLPNFPAPVGPTGYDLLYRNDLMGHDPSFLSVSIQAGEYGPGWVENRVRVRPDTEHQVWRDPERGLQILDVMLQVWKPEWVCAYASKVVLSSEDDEIRSRVRPWLAWTLKPLQPRPNPPYARPYPAPFPLDDAGPPDEVRAWRGGELCIWP
jgi:hypothetical protein